MSSRTVLTVAFLMFATFSCNGKVNADTIDGDIPYATVSGTVTCNGKPLKGVAVSDGFDVVCTDSKGAFSISTKKEHGYVFVSIPSGYKAPSEGILPQFFKYLTKDAGTDETVQFSLNKDEKSQKKHTMLIFGDIHLANRTNDRAQFAGFTSEISAYINEHPKDNIYAMTLGDMTWDIYWTPNSYCFDEYLRDMGAVGDLQIFHTIGNHDHDIAWPGDWKTAERFKKSLCPTYYSFNIGDIHYMVLDDIECTNTAGGTAADRHYRDKMTDYQLEWIKKDLALVPTGTPVIVTMHATLFKETGEFSMTDGAELLECFKDHPFTQFYSGHSHRMFNYANEHNSGAVCAAWWWCGYYTPGLNISQDGSPSGYKILNVQGNRISARFKAVGRPDDEVFRSYDRNEIEITADRYAPDAKKSSATKLANVAGKYAEKDNGNYVLINIWDWSDDWKISVTENGIPLEVTRIRDFDPLYIIAYTAKRCNANGSLTFAPCKTGHLFQVKASSPSGTITIKVTDSQGNVHKETMARPKPFTLENYVQTAGR